MNKDYSVKKKYVEQKYQLGVTTYENGVEKTQKKPLCEIPMMIGEQEWTISKLVQEYEKTKLQADKVPILEEQIKILKEAVNSVVETLKGAL